MQAEEELRAGRPEQALALLQDEVRKAPNNPKLRIFLFQLLSVLGRWERALVQLKVAGDLDPLCLSMVQTYREAIRCEVLREQVFAAKRTPMFFGQPDEWMAWSVEALALDAKGMPEQARDMRQRAMDAAPTTSGVVDGKPFEWIADGDCRIGPMLEVIIHGRYYWMPLHRAHAIRIEAPSDLRDVVWMPAWLTLTTGAEVVALIPTRYPGSAVHADDRIRMARLTEWIERPDGYAGVGQRQLVTHDAEYPLMDIRELKLNTEIVAAADPQERPVATDG